MAQETRILPDVPKRVEFTCVECGRQIIRFYGEPADPKLCACCVMLPGWFRDLGLRKVIDPEHSGVERGLNDEPHA